MDFEIHDVDLYNKPEDISVMNPYGQVPILVERDLILYESNIINRYIDERFPHPQLMPGTRWTAPACGCSCSISKELFVRNPRSESRRQEQREAAGEVPRPHPGPPDAVGPIFLKNKVHARRGFSMLDVAIAPLLWRLDYYGIDLSRTPHRCSSTPERIFSRPPTSRH